jgi:G:T/U-mismatch repair DNA glycosylase
MLAATDQVINLCDKAQAGKGPIFEVVSLVEVGLRRDLEVAVQELTDTRRKLIEHEARITQLQLRKKDWKMKYLNLALKRCAEPKTAPTELNPTTFTGATTSKGTESTCTTPTMGTTSSNLARPPPAV